LTGSSTDFQHMRCVFIADVHANREALTTVLEDIRDRWAGLPIFFLGDILNYGPEPQECIALVREHCLWSIRGNHEQTLLDNTGARKGPFTSWTLDHLSKSDTDWLKQLPLQHDGDEFVAAHAIPVGDTSTPGKVYCLTEPYLCPPRKGVEYYLEMLADRFSANPKLRLAVFGHVHSPYIWPLGGGVIRSSSATYTHKVTGPTLVCVPSVGQPRDGDPRTGYAVVDGDTLSLIRIPYDIERTVNEILQRKSPNPERMVKALRSGSTKH
jgi:predicted phosphodiesterase